MKKEPIIDKEVGDRFTSRPRVITDEELDRFYDMTGIKENIFEVDEAARSLGLGYKKRIVAGAYLLQLAFSFGCELELALDVPMVGVNNVKFISPVYPGDEVRLEGEVIGKKVTSKGHVVVTWSWVLKNQNNVVVAQGEVSEFFPKS